MLLSLLVEPILQVPYTHKFTSHALSPFSPVPSQCIIYPSVDRAQIDIILPPSQKWLILTLHGGNKPFCKATENCLVSVEHVSIGYWGRQELLQGCWNLKALLAPGGLGLDK